MATIIKLNKPCGVRYKVIIRSGQRVLKTRTFQKKAEASQWAKRIEGDSKIMASLDCMGGSMTLSELVEIYLQEWAQSHKDIKNQSWRAAWWVERLGNKRLKDITPGLIRTALASMGSVQPATYNRQRAVISAILTYAEKEDYIPFNPCAKVRSRKIRNRRIRFLTDDERRRLLAACDRSSWSGLGLLVRMALATGARRGELLGLTWSDINFKRSVANLRDTKNDEPRVLPIPSVVLRELKKRHGISRYYVFESERNPGKPMVEFRRHFFKALEDAGIEDFRFHDLRHSAASYLVMSGATLYETAQILGHKSVVTTQRYAHLSDQHKAELSERILGGQFSSSLDDSGSD